MTDRFDDQETRGWQAASSSPKPEAARKERRRSQRVNRVFGAEIEPEGTQPTHIRLFVINVSSSGLRATTTQMLPEDCALRIRLQWDRRSVPLTLDARVVWQRELSLNGMFELGCEFLELSGADWARLCRYIESARS